MVQQPRANDDLQSVDIGTPVRQIYLGRCNSVGSVSIKEMREVADVAPIQELAP